MGIDFSKYNILVVEDSQINLFLLKQILEKESLNVFLALNATEAMQILQKHAIDLILMDVLMDEMDGFQFTAKLKSIDDYRDIPILFLTGLNSSDDIVKGFDLGGVDYITKPFNKQELLRRVKHQIKLVDSYRTIVKRSEELKIAIENRDKLYAVMSHDLRTPISSLKMIFNILSLKKDNNFNSEHFNDMLYTGNEIAEQLFCLLDNLLKWAKNNLGVLTFQPEKFDLVETIRGVVETVTPNANLKNVNFDLYLDDNVEVEFDIDMMNSILRNLLMNAAKFSYSNSTIIVRLKKSAEEVDVVIEDSGIGMSEIQQQELRSRINNFEQVGGTNEQGKGIGLWIVSNFIQTNHGLFYFESELNKGSKFGFKIPKLSPLKVVN